MTAEEENMIYLQNKEQSVIQLLELQKSSKFRQELYEEYENNLKDFKIKLDN